MTKYLSESGLATVIDGIMSRVSLLQHSHDAEDIISGKLSSDRMPAATSSKLGGVKVGSRLSVTADGTLSASAPSQVVASSGIPTNTDAIIWIKTN